MFDTGAIDALYLGDKKLVESLQTYLLSRDLSNLKLEFQRGNGKIKVDCFENQLPVELELEKHVFLSAVDYYSRNKELMD
ncbi:isoleucine--tRNA ligase, cytoplasmic-like [Zingiber officinale]|nr:isoleucine--tRNA ligase, cytoplasmic-like [Zingiber officinale]